MTEEDRIFAGKLFTPLDPALKALKLRAHNLSCQYNQTMEDEVEKRADILEGIFGEGLGEGSFFQGPIYIHYGRHTKIGKKLFANFNLTIQDDAEVHIGDSCCFGPGVTIVTPAHPLLAGERGGMAMPDGSTKYVCYAKPVRIGNSCWLGANVTICPGVTVGDNCVIGAGSVVTRDIPPNSLAAGVPCRVLREVSPADSLYNRPELF